MDGSADDDSVNENEEVTLLDLPEPVLLQIFSYFDLSFLRYVAPKVSVAFRCLSRSRTLWSNAVLSFASQDAWEESISEQFIRELKVTPYVRHLNVSCLESLPIVESALASTRCRIHRLSLQVKNYNPSWILMLKRHPEIQELELSDDALDDEITACIGQVVGSMVPSLKYLNLSHSGLLSMPVTGLLLSAASHQGDVPVNKSADWAPSDHARHYPAGHDPLVNPAEAMDVDDCDEAPSKSSRGLEHLTHLPFENMLLGAIEENDLGGDTLSQATAGHNLATLILGNCHSLQDVQVDIPHPEVYRALAKCTRLKKLSVKCDVRAEGLCAMLEAMTDTGMRTLRSLRLVAPPSLQAKDLEVVLQSLGRLEARLDSLDLVGAASASPSAPLTFPGFEAFAGLLLASPGRREPPCLRAIRLDDIAPVGRLELAQLVQLVRSPRPAPKLPLRRLELSDCVCSEEREFGECRERMDEALKRFLPDLELVTSNRWLGYDDEFDVGFMPLYTCDCARRPRWTPRLPIGRGGGGRRGRAAP